MSVPSQDGRRTLAAWERFVAGDDDVADVRAPILLSWYRSRDVHRIDPVHARPPRSTGPGRGPSLLQDTVLTQLGGMAASLAQRLDGALIAVTDGSGRVLGCWGAGEVRRRAARARLAPMYTWSEAAIGTNAMGTSLGGNGPSSVHGPEHWCASLREWSSTSVSVSDPVTGRCLGLLSWSAWRPGTAARAPDAALRDAVRPLQSLAREHARLDGATLVAGFLAAAGTTAPGQALVAVDDAGNVVAANPCAQESGENLPAVPAVDPELRVHAVSPQVRVVVGKAGRRARQDPGWTGAARLDLLREEATFEIRPVVADGRVVGALLLATAAPDGEWLSGEDGNPAAASQPGCTRVVGTCGSRLILLRPDEIRYAEADRHEVWLTTDRGRVRAASRGLDNVERELAPFGFLRVHRGYLVNVHRIQEVDQGICRGTLTVSTRHHGREAIPVARRQVPRLRGALGI